MTPSCLLNTALPTLDDRPLCQNPPSPITEIERLAALTLKAEAEAGPSPYPIVVAPILNGGKIENRWQPISAATWWGPSCCSTSFMAAKIGRSGHPVQNPGGRGGTTSASALTFGWPSTSTASGSGG